MTEAIRRPMFAPTVSVPSCIRGTITTSTNSAFKGTAGTPGTCRPAVRGRRSAIVVLVVAAPPGVGLVASLGCAVEPLIHAPKPVQSARVGGIGMVDDAVLEHERAHPWP